MLHNLGLKTSTLLNARFIYVFQSTRFAFRAVTPLDVMKSRKKSKKFRPVPPPLLSKGHLLKHARVDARLVLSVGFHNPSQRSRVVKKKRRVP